MGVGRQEVLRRARKRCQGHITSKTTAKPVGRHLPCREEPSLARSPSVVPAAQSGLRARPPRRDFLRVTSSDLSSLRLRWLSVLDSWTGIQGVALYSVGMHARKRVCIVGAGASGSSAAYALSRHPDEFEVTVFDKEAVAGGMATSIDIDAAKYGASYINDVSFLKSSMFCAHCVLGCSRMLPRVRKHYQDVQRTGICSHGGRHAVRILFVRLDIDSICAPQN